MATNHTEKLQLSQWVESDLVLMDDFNADNQKIDDAIQAIDDGLNALQEVVVVESGYTYIDKMPRPIAFDWTDLTCVVSMDDGNTHTIDINVDDEGTIIDITIDGHVASVTGV